MEIRRSAMKAFVIATVLALAVIAAVAPKSGERSGVSSVSIGSLQFETEYL
jgi:hypothetical protein